MPAVWFYKKNNTEYGPVETAALRRMAIGGELAPSDLIWREGMAEWVPASRGKGLFPEGTAPVARGPGTVAPAATAPLPSGHGLSRSAIVGVSAGVLVLAAVAVGYWYFSSPGKAAPGTDGSTTSKRDPKDYVYIKDDGEKYSYITTTGPVDITRFVRSHKQIKDYCYLAGSDAVTITRYTGNGGAVTIPDRIEGLPVTSIGHRAFMAQSGGEADGCAKLTSVTIPGSVTTIGDTAFMNCTRLSNIVIPKGVTSIGTETFHGCKSLTSVTIPDGVTSIGKWVFFYCSSLTNVTIPNSVTSIGAEAFVGCTSLTSITIPDSVTSIAENAFGPGTRQIRSRGTSP